MQQTDRPGCSPEILGRWRLKGIGKNISALAHMQCKTAGVQVCEPCGRFQDYGGFHYESLETPAIISYIWPKKDWFWALLYQVDTSK